MILTAHILTGAAVANSFTQPWLSALASFITHYIMDAIPHREYSIKRISAGERGVKIIPNLFRVGLDIIFAVLILIFIAPARPQLIVFGLVSILPDGLLFLYLQQKQAIKAGRSNLFTKILVANRKLHHRIHIWKSEKVPWIIGITTQGLAIILSVWILTR